MKQECPTYLKTIGKSKVLAATLSDIEPEDDSDNEDEGILNSFTAIANPTEGIVEDVDEQDDIHIAYAKLNKVSKKHEKLYRLATKKLSNEEIE